jgi:hypothetical protein
LVAVQPANATPSAATQAFVFIAIPLRTLTVAD